MHFMMSTLCGGVVRQRGDKGGNDVAHFFEGVSSLGIPFRGKLLVGDGARKKNFEPESSVANEKGEDWWTPSQQSSYFCKPALT
jgi:hypothetical protein